MVLYRLSYVIFVNIYVKSKVTNACGLALKMKEICRERGGGIDSFTELLR